MSTQCNGYDNTSKPGESHGQIGNKRKKKERENIYIHKESLPLFYTNTRLSMETSMTYRLGSDSKDKERKSLPWLIEIGDSRYGF